MRTVIDGLRDGQPIRVIVQDGEITYGQDSPAAADMQGLADAGVVLDIPSMWSGKASLDDPWAVRAMALDLFDEVKIAGDEPPDLNDPEQPPDAEN